jgi:chromosomal replication initiation ATPase DnaA|tara:strand:+ start:37 stop:438 length:402 start_codon:yes stop_codon:yes gene_type:complete
MKEKSKSLKPSESDMTLARMAVVASSIAFGIEADEIIRPHRGAERITMARQTTYWLLRVGGVMSYKKIGEVLGGRDHGTTLHGYRKVENELELNLPRGYAQCILDAEKYFNEFSAHHRSKELARKSKEFENAV